MPSAPIASGVAIATMVSDLEFLGIPLSVEYLEPSVYYSVGEMTMCRSLPSPTLSLFTPSVFEAS